MLIKRWKEMNDSEILKEIQMLFLNFSNAVNLFSVDENHEPIVYCADHSGNTEIETYGKETGICYSEKTAKDAVKWVIMNHAEFLIPFLCSDMPTFDFGIKGLPEPIGFFRNENGEEIEIREAVFVFEKCSNQAGFCIGKVIPLR